MSVKIQSLFNDSIAVKKKCIETGLGVLETIGKNIAQSIENGNKNNAMW